MAVETEGEKPGDIAAYGRWLATAYAVRVDRAENHYASVSNKVKLDFEASEFWTRFASKLGDYADQYHVDTGYLLFASRPDPPQLLVKSFDAFLNKTFRRNVLNNAAWPGEPDGGWLVPPVWFGRVNDIVRTSFVVKYLDGVERMVSLLENQCRLFDVGCNVSFEAREEGYYAAHVVVRQDYEIPRPDWDTETTNMGIEIQVTTQLQEAIRSLTHKYYERRRLANNEDTTKWQWNYRSDEFTPNYLGHILHYVEGMIMDVRDRK